MGESPSPPNRVSSNPSLPLDVGDIVSLQIEYVFHKDCRSGNFRGIYRFSEMRITTKTRISFLLSGEELL